MKCLLLEIHHSHQAFECLLSLNYLLLAEPAMGSRKIKLRGQWKGNSGQQNIIIFAKSWSDVWISAIKMLGTTMNREEMYVSLGICLLAPLNIKMKYFMNFLDRSQLLKKKTKDMFFQTNRSHS